MTELEKLYTSLEKEEEKWDEPYQYAIRSDKEIEQRKLILRVLGEVLERSLGKYMG